MSKLSPQNATGPSMRPSYRERIGRPFVRANADDRSSFLSPRTHQVQTNKLEATGSVSVSVNFTEELKGLIIRALAYNPLFYALPSADVLTLVSKLGFYEIGPNQVIYEEEYPPTNFYILTEGRAVMRSKKKVIRELRPGCSFGDTELINGNPRTHTVETTQSSSFVSLDIEDFNTFLKLVQTLNYEVLRNFNYTLKQLETLPSQFIDALSKFAVLVRYPSGANIITEGEIGTTLYFILEGDAAVSSGGESIRRLRAGDCFGEQALLYDGVRTATVDAVTEIRCEAVPKQVLYRLFGSNLDDFIYTNTARIAFDRDPTLKSLSNSEKERLIEEMRVVTYGYDEIVLAMGAEKSNTLVVVLNGSLCTRRGLDMRESEHFATVYDCICAQEVMAGFSDSVFQTDIVADTDEVAVGEINRAAFHACLGTVESVLRSVSTRQFKGIQILEELPREKQLAIVKALEIREYSDGDVICQQNDPGVDFFILKSGRAVIVRDGIIVRTVTKSDYFGEKALLNNKQRTASIYAEGHCVVWVLNLANFNRFFDENAKAAMRNRIERTDVTMTLFDLIPVTMLGRGTFGFVFLVTSRNNELYALKAIDRKQITSKDACDHITMERNVLMQINHKFIMKLVKTFKDRLYVYFLMEYIKGVTLFEILHESGRLTTEESTFYMAIIVQMLEYLHEREIVHRDLKPENMMVTEDGYLKLVDFGSAKVIRGRTYSRLGTPSYMAPEVIQVSGHGPAADLWSVGIMLYEFACGRTPFGEEEEDPYIILKLVIDEELVFPSFMKENSDCKLLITQLLQKNPYNRISLTEVKRHKFFRNFDWNALTLGSMKSPRIPPEPKNLEKLLQSAKRRNKNLHAALQECQSDDEEEESIPRDAKKLPPPPNWDEYF